MRVTFKVILVGLLTIIISTQMFACKAKDSSKPEHGQDVAQVKSLIKDLQRAFEREDVHKLVELAHSDYYQFRTEHREKLSDVFRLYSQIDLEFFAPRVRQADKGDGLFAQTNWNLRWTCQDVEPAVDCTNEGDIIRRRGRTTFDFKQEDGEWKLLNQRGQDLIFGSRSPGMKVN